MTSFKIFKNFYHKYRKEKIYPPYILLTNFCNQNCAFCFAKKEMSASKIKEMPLSSFRKLVVILKKEGVDTLKLLGGEPTLHSHFSKIMDIASKNFSNFVIFTNGIMPILNKKALIDCQGHIEIWFNIDTYAFRKNKPLKKEVISNLFEFLSRPKTEVILTFTISDLNKDYIKYFKEFDQDFLSKIGVRIGIANPVYGENHFLLKKDFKKAGKQIIRIVKHLLNRKVKRFIFDCGLSRGMFTNRQIAFLKEKNIDLLFGCEGKKGLDISTDLSIFPCYPFHKYLRMPASKLNEFRSLQKILLKKKISCDKRTF